MLINDLVNGFILIYSFLQGEQGLQGQPGISGFPGQKVSLKVQYSS